MKARASLPFLDRNLGVSIHETGSYVYNGSLCLWYRRRRCECTYHSVGMMWSHTSNVVEDKQLPHGPFDFFTVT
jgi:hypothetical protein